MHDQARTQRVMGVLVLYGRKLEQVASWRFLLGAMRVGQIKPERSLSLAHCLIYDNSPQPLAESALPSGVIYQSNTANGGTAMAYAAAIDLANVHGCGWLLLLDQDTLLPGNYLETAASLLETPKAVGAAVLMPQILHGEQRISPAVISRFGSVTPGAGKGAGITTAISSGLLIKTDTLAQHLPNDPVFWLDYLDHMIFLALSRSGVQVATMDILIGHDLSVQNPTNLSYTRLRSILAAERAFCCSVSGSARAVLPLRRLWRASKYLAHNPSLSFKLFCSAFT